MPSCGAGEPAPRRASVDRAHLQWQGASPRLFLNMFPASFNGLYVMGMIEASGIGWQGRYEQAELIAEYLAALERAPERAGEFRRRETSEPWPDLTGGYRYLGLERMSYYVNKDAYRRAVRAATTTRLEHGPHADPDGGAVT